MPSTNGEVVPRLAALGWFKFVPETKLAANMERLEGLEHASPNGDLAADFIDTPPVGELVEPRYRKIVFMLSSEHRRVCAADAETLAEGGVQQPYAAAEAEGAEARIFGGGRAPR